MKGEQLASQSYPKLPAYAQVSVININEDIFGSTFGLLSSCYKMFCFQHSHRGIVYLLNTHTINRLCEASNIWQSRNDSSK